MRQERRLLLYEPNDLSEPNGLGGGASVQVRSRDGWVCSKLLIVPSLRHAGHTLYATARELRAHEQTRANALILPPLSFDTGDRELDVQESSQLAVSPFTVVGHITDADVHALQKRTRDNVFS